MPDPVEWKIIENIQSELLAKVNGAGGYNFDVVEVLTFEKQPEDRGGMPNVTIIPQGSSKVTVGFGDALGYREGTLSVLLDCIVFNAQETQYHKKMWQFAHDVEKALAVDPTRGGFARLTEIKNIEPVPQWIAMPMGVVLITVEVTYGSSYVDPAVAN